MKAPTLSPSDQCKTLISDMTAEEIEDVIRYGRFRLHQLKQKAKKAAKNGKESVQNHG